MAADAPVVDDLLTRGANADPHSVFAQLREHAPVWWSAPLRAWLVTRYEDVSKAFQNRALSSDRVRPLLAARRTEQSAATNRVQELLSQWMVVSDPPEHTRLRRLAAGAFKQQRIAELADVIQRRVDDLLDGYLAGRHSDLIEHVAYPLPAIVIAELLGAPPEDRDRFRYWSDELALVAFGAGGQARAERHERALSGLEDMFAYISELADRRRREPGADMLSALIAGDGSGEQLTADELVAMCALLLFAGHETTTNSIANGIVTLLEHPDQLAMLRSEPDLIAPAVEELLRYEGPIKVVNRWVTADTEIHGRTVRSGERVYLCLASANRDTARFDAPDVLDLRRSPNPHIAFGKGVHACIGAQLARMETRIAITSIVQRLPTVRRTGDLMWKESLAARSLHELPLSYETGG